MLSEAMQAFLGLESCGRHQVVKAIWVYIKEHSLQVNRVCVSSYRNAHVTLCSVLLPQLLVPGESETLRRRSLSRDWLNTWFHSACFDTQSRGHKSQGVSEVAATCGTIEQKVYVD